MSVLSWHSLDLSWFRQQIVLPFHLFDIGRTWLLSGSQTKN